MKQIGGALLALLVSLCLSCQKQETSPTPPPAKRQQKDRDTAPNAKVALKRPGWLGIVARTRQKGEERWIEVVRVTPHSPAAQVGLKKGDQILSLNNAPVADVRSFFSILKATGEGGLVTLRLRRNGQFLDLKVQLDTPRQEHLQEVFTKALQWLEKQQNPDGGFAHFEAASTRSSAPMTALVLSALVSLPNRSMVKPQVVEKGIGYLLKNRLPQGLLGDVKEPVHMESYTTALTLIVLTKWNSQKYAAEIQNLQKALLDYQIDERAGYSVYDYQYGGWNYWSGKKRSMMRTDISVASFVLEALFLSGVPEKHPVFQKARHFIYQCQNYGPKNPHQDGGFRFSPVESKAGIAHEEGDSLYFRSYGSVTADGVRALFYCHEPKSSPRLKAALAWLGEHFQLHKNPGFPARDPARFSRGILYYYYASLAKALALTKSPILPSPRRDIFWATELASWLLPKQSPEGFWKSSEEVMHEDHPVLTTSLALLALSHAYPYLPTSEKK